MMALSWLMGISGDPSGQEVFECVGVGEAIKKVISEQKSVL
jgi:hypothetical protein